MELFYVNTQANQKPVGMIDIYIVLIYKNIKLKLDIDIRKYGKLSCLVKQGIKKN